VILKRPQIKIFITFFYSIIPLSNPRWALWLHNLNPHELLVVDHGITVQKMPQEKFWGFFSII